MSNLFLTTKVAFEEHFIYITKESKKINTCTLFLESLIEFLIKPREISEHAGYVIAREVISVLISFISSPLFTLSQILHEKHSIDDIPLEICLKSNPFLRFFANLNEKKSKKLSAILIEYSIQNVPLPNPPSSAWSTKSGGSFLRAFKKKLGHSNSAKTTQLPLASISLFLSLLKIFSPMTTEFQSDLLESEQSQNPYRLYLANSKNSTSQDMIANLKKINFEQIIEFLQREDPINEISLFFVYHLLERNNNFVEYFIQHKDISNFVMIFLEKIYQLIYKEIDSKSDEKNVNYEGLMYLLLSILLILSQNKIFCNNAFNHSIESVSWYKKNPLVNEKIGNIIILVISEIISIYLPTLSDTSKLNLCFGIISNLSSSFKDISFYASEEIAIIFDFLTKKLQVLGKFELDDDETDPTSSMYERDKKVRKANKKKKKKMEKNRKKQRSRRKKTFQENIKINFDQGDYQLRETLYSEWIDIETLNPPPTTLTRPERLIKKKLVNKFDIPYKEMTHELNFYTDLLVLTCEILHSGVTQNISKNIKLLFTLFPYEIQLSNYQHHPRLYNFVSNSLIIIRFFKNELKKKFPEKNYTTEIAITHLKRVVSKLKFDEKGIHLDKKQIFRYIADESEVNHYLFGYTWDLIARYSGMYWDEDIVKILK
ncbi:dymeclin [Anaeramoeba flamelloides]|uniref:Dymeclin n=1 Tax=Anaeramoeba flamelloides TaxID=1746091 RepID=A0AAV7YZA8_9EUKA|nr:dymeclin [Anaeramoeba flamelloides]